MYDGRLVDCHSHVFPTPEAREPLVGQFAAVVVDDDGGLVPSALHYLERTGVEQLNLLLLHCSGSLYHRGTQHLRHDHGLAAPEGQVRAEELQVELAAATVAYNEWGVETCRAHPELSCFVGLNPVLMDGPSLWAELEDKARRGALGVKLAPFDYLAPSGDRRLWPIYDFCQSRGLPVLFAPPLRCSYLARPEVWGHLFELMDVLRAFPRLKVCMAHLASGANRIRDFHILVEMAKSYPTLHADLSGIISRIATGALGPDDVVAMVREVGVDRVLFGTNFGTRRTEESIADADAFRHLALGASEFRAIGHENFERLTAGS